MAGNDRITLGFGADTSEVERGTDRIADSLDTVDRKLDDVGQTGEAAGDAAAGGLDNVGASAGDVGGQLGDLGGIASDVLEGDLAGGARSAAGALSGLAALIPGVGALIGSGLALASNLFVSQWEQAAKTSEDRIRDMYEDMIESGNNFASTEAVNSAIKEIIEDEGKLAVVKTNAAEAGVRVSLALRAEAGDQTALAAVLASIRDRRADLQAQQDAYVAKNGQLSAALDEQIGATERLEVSYEAVGDWSDTAAAKADLYRQATENAGTATGKLGDDIAALPTSVFVGIKVDTAGAKKQIDDFIRDQRNRHLPIVADVVDRLNKRLP